jgi:hypothetical protein
VLRKRAIQVVVETDEAATVTVSGTIGIPPRAALVRLRPATKRVAAHTSTRFTLRVTKKGVQVLRRALRGRRKLTAKIKVRSTDAAGNRAVTSHSIRVVR